ncbi:hypothetical protein HF325_006289 [Metschnikowia pulcherrima]|uniref:Uncharacterized protein n=1 Tax=Metschnikowia pulcherrima TaxID=27326 RepID=A0A8H7GM46_9ASCO|nr:hypothetical protein HF325_006289 [Metschnikowia pulcherrima]
MYAIITVLACLFFCVSALPSEFRVRPAISKSKSVPTLIQTGPNQEGIVGDVYRLDLFAYDRQKPQALNSTREAEELIRWFVVQLRGFILKSHFHASSFKVVSRRLFEDLEDIQSLALEALSENFALMGQLWFAKRMYDVMDFAATQLIMCEKYTITTAVFLLRATIELNVQLWLLFDANGNLDVTIPLYRNLLVGHWRTVCCWDEEFRNLKNVPDHVRRLFEDLKALVELTIADLFRHMP